MHTIEAEYQLAREEVSFWRDFAVRWRAREGASGETRVDEMLALAEQRFARAGRLLHERTTTTHAAPTSVEKH